MRVGKEVLDQFFTDNEVKPGFSGIGKFRGRTDYSEDEKTVLKYFFTNIESNVYCATDNMPSELWALLLGQYARSDMTARDRLLKLFRDVKEASKKDSFENVPSVEGIAEFIKDQRGIPEFLGFYLQAAGKFIDRYGVKYGHASLRDSGTVRICFEGISQRATKFLESAREGAYQEQSTRAIPFSMENMGIPLEIRGTKYEERMITLDRELIAFYDRIREILPRHLKSKYAELKKQANMQIAEAVKDNNARLSNSEWNRIIKEKAFDVARFLLPQHITTSLGITLNTRRFQDQLTEWQSLEFGEMQILGRAAQLESMKIHPTLMKYGNPSEFYRSLPERRRKLFERLISRKGEKEFEFGHYPIQSKLIGFTPEIEARVLASILLNGSDGKFSFEEMKERVKRLPLEEKVEIARSQFIGKQSYEIHPKSMEAGGFVFERFYDIGAYRDLQRQRGDRQQIAPYSVIGYHMPKEIGGIGLEKEFVALIHKVKDLHDDLKADGFHEVSEYIPVMANLVRHVTTKDPVQAFYEAKLRTQAAGIDSYRTIARQEIKQVLDVMPSFREFVEFDNNEYPLNKLPEAVKNTIARLCAKKSS